MVNVTHRNVFPAITFCDDKLMRRNYFAYCGVTNFQEPANKSQPCQKQPEHFSEIKNMAKQPGQWSNGLFNVKECFTWGSK